MRKRENIVTEITGYGLIPNVDSNGILLLLKEKLHSTEE